VADTFRTIKNRQKATCARGGFISFFQSSR